MIDDNSTAACSQLLGNRATHPRLEPVTKATLLRMSMKDSCWSCDLGNDYSSFMFSSFPMNRFLIVIMGASRMVAGAAAGPPPAPEMANHQA